MWAFSRFEKFCSADVRRSVFFWIDSSKVRNRLEIVVSLDSRELSSKEIRSEVLVKVERNRLECVSGVGSRFSACAEYWLMVLLHLSLIDWSLTKKPFRVSAEGFRSILHNPEMFFIENSTSGG